MWNWRSFLYQTSMSVLEVAENVVFGLTSFCRSFVRLLTICLFVFSGKQEHRSGHVKECDRELSGSSETENQPEKPQEICWCFPQVSWLFSVMNNLILGANNSLEHLVQQKSCWYFLLGNVNEYFDRFCHTHTSYARINLCALTYSFNYA